MPFWDAAILWEQEKNSLTLRRTYNGKIKVNGVFVAIYQYFAHSLIPGISLKGRYTIFVYIFIYIHIYLIFFCILIKT